MTKKILIDASHSEEIRVVLTHENRIEEFDVESHNKKQLKGNIYLARVTRVEPSLQAAFIEYGRSRHGFLAFNEIHPDYYQIPIADRQALLQEEAQAFEKEELSSKRTANESNTAQSDENFSVPENTESADPKKHNNRRKRRHKKSVAESVFSESKSGKILQEIKINEESGEEIAAIGGSAEDVFEEVAHNRRKPIRRPYKIQEVIKRKQILLVQVVKEERGHKGASMTTYLSLAGRYSVLMPNTTREGGVSRKITNFQDRQRLKSIIKDFKIPQGMGIILRTAGENRTKGEIKRDFEYLIRLWENVRSLTLESTAPALVYEEGNLIKRSIRDLYKKDITEILVSGEEAYREAKDFMRMLIPSHTKIVKRHRAPTPVFNAEIEKFLDDMSHPQVMLPSGGHIVINQTEALVAIDVNSGKSTREHSIENTALQTNLEASEEIAHQLRLRDLAGLIVVDFIDMEEIQNKRLVEKKFKECLKNDRARIQVGRISHFGLLEMSRQRIRSSILESTMKLCPQCSGSGHIRPDSSLALLILRAIEDYLIKNNRHHIIIKTSPEIALYILNHKRDILSGLEKRFELSINFESHESMSSQEWVIVKGAVLEKNDSQKSIAEDKNLRQDSVEEEEIKENLPLKDKENDKKNYEQKISKNSQNRQRYKNATQRSRHTTLTESSKIEIQETEKTIETASDLSFDDLEKKQEVISEKNPDEKTHPPKKGFRKNKHSKIRKTRFFHKKETQKGEPVKEIQEPKFSPEKSNDKDISENKKEDKIGSQRTKRNRVSSEGNEKTKISLTAVGEGESVIPRKGWWQRKGLF